MKNFFSHLIVGAALLLPTAGCDTGEPAPSAPRLVVEGWFNSDSYPEVLLNMSMVPADEEQSVAESIVRWGKVTISDGEEEVILTGGPSEKYFPPYHYYTFDMVGEPGKTYTLRAYYHGMTVSSTVTMPHPTPIEGIAVTPVEGNDTLRHLTLRFNAPEDTPAYYHLSARVYGADNREYPCMLGTHEVLRPGEIVELPVYRANRSTTGTNDYVADFPAGSLVSVTLARVSREVFEFWRAFDNASLVSGSVFVGAPGSLPSNISGGYGVWSPQGASTTRVLVE